MANLIQGGSRLTPARLGGQWQDYTPTWSASSNPVISNGTIIGRWRMDSTTVHATGRILMGSSTTYGSGAWRLSLPVSARDGVLHVGSGLAFDASSAAAGSRPVAVWLVSTALVQFQHPSGEVGATGPFTWAVNDQLRWSITYEAAV